MAAKRACIYARFSSDRQSERSITDQAVLCRTFAERQGWQVVEVYSDAAVSGETIHGRTDFARMVADARAGKFELIVAEDIDRLARNIADTMQLRDRMEFVGIEIHTVADGFVTPMNAMLKGFTSAEFLKTHRLKVRRGAAGNIREGKHAGGLAYGYRPTPGDPGRWVIHPEEAAIVHRIFVEYSTGDRSRVIINRLNAEGIKPPRGRYWRPGTITGNRKRHNGILGNEIYAGRLVWNKLRMVKDPDTGKRISRPNPEVEWHRADAPHLRIVDVELFDAVQAVRGNRAAAAPVHRRKPRHLLSGLLRCGSCGGGMTVKGSDRGGARIVCTQFRDAGTCSHGRSYYLHHVERTILDGLRDHLVDPRAIRLFLQKYHAERKRLAADSSNTKRTLERHLGEVGRKLERAMSAMLESTAPVSTYTGTIADLEGQKTRLAAELAAIDKPVKVVALHPAAQERYLAIVTDLARALKAKRPAGEMAGALRELIESATVIPTAPGSPVEIDVKGRLAALIDAPAFPQMSGRKAVAEDCSGLKNRHGRLINQPSTEPNNGSSGEGRNFTPSGLPAFPFRCRG